MIDPFVASDLGISLCIINSMFYLENSIISVFYPFLGHYNTSPVAQLGAEWSCMQCEKSIFPKDYQTNQTENTYISTGNDATGTRRLHPISHVDCIPTLRRRPDSPSFWYLAFWSFSAHFSIYRLEVWNFSRILGRFISFKLTNYHRRSKIIYLSSSKNIPNNTYTYIHIYNKL